MGYLDKQSRVIDFVLTERGRKLLAAGQLNFEYFALFDDLIDYDPVSGADAFDDDDRTAQIEATPIMEAPVIPDTRGTVAPLEPRSHIFTAGAGYVRLPHLVSPTDASEIDLYADQRVVDGGYERTATSLAQLDLAVSGDTQRGNPGFIVRVLSSGSNGHTELSFRRDLSGRRSYDPFIAATVDSEEQLERPTVSKPDSRRKP